MARARNLKPSFFTNDELAALPPLTRLLFAGLWTVADRAGRLEDRPLRIKAEVLPYDNCKVDRMLQELHDHNFIFRFGTKGIRYIQILAFNKHQNPHVKEAESTIPAPDLNGASTVLVPEIPATTGLIPDSLNLIPDSGFPLPPSLVATAPSEPRVEKPKPDPNPTATAAAFNAYASAYSSRYGSEPVRNARVMGQMSDLVKRLGKEDAASVAAWFVSSNNAFYVTKGHSVGALLTDAEKLRTEWVRGRSVTATEARQGDKTAALGNVFGELLEEERKKKNG